MTEAALYPRFAEPRLAEALADSPAVLIHGPRQCGKTTLARTSAAARDYPYVSFDDDAVRAAAAADPMGFVADLPERVILDEVQRAPAIAGVEVKASGTVTASDFRGLRKLAGAAGARFAGGAVLYDGEFSASFGDRLYAVPLSRLWAGP